MKVRGQVQLQLILPLQRFAHRHFSKADGCLTGGSKPRFTAKKTLCEQLLESFLFLQKYKQLYSDKKQHVLNEQQSTEYNH